MLRDEVLQRIYMQLITRAITTNSGKIINRGIDKKSVFTFFPFPVIKMTRSPAFFCHSANEKCFTGKLENKIVTARKANFHE